MNKISINIVKYQKMIVLYISYMYTKLYMCVIDM